MIIQKFGKKGPMIIWGIIFVWALFASLDLAERAGVVQETSHLDELAISRWAQALKSDFSSSSDHLFVLTFLLSGIAAFICTVRYQHQLLPQFHLRPHRTSLRLHQLYSTYLI